MDRRRCYSFKIPDEWMKYTVRRIQFVLKEFVFIYFHIKGVFISSPAHKLFYNYKNRMHRLVR